MTNINKTKKLLFIITKQNTKVPNISIIKPNVRRRSRTTQKYNNKNRNQTHLQKHINFHYVHH